MNDLVTTLGIASWKGVVGALLLPPVPLLLLVLTGVALVARRRVLGTTLVVLGCVGLWLACTLLPGMLLRALVLDVPPALSAAALTELKRASGPKTAIVVLGGGRRLLAPEYGVSNLLPVSMERLRYGLWLARETGLPVAFSGGVGYGGAPGPTEAEIAARIAEREFGRPLRWTETRSRDTTENGLLTVPLLQQAGIARIVLVTHDFHMQRAVRAFERSAARSGTPMAIVAAPMGLRPASEFEWRDLLPSGAGFQDTLHVLHETLGWIAGS